MKRTYLISAALTVVAIIALIAATSSPGWTQRSVYRSKVFYTNTARTDTSAAINTNGNPFVEIATSAVNTDSAHIRIAVDYRIGSTWILNAKLDTLAFGDGTATRTKARGTVVLSPHAAATIPGSATIRIRNTLVPFAAADSTGIAAYTQNVVIRQ